MPRAFSDRHRPFCQNNLTLFENRGRKNTTNSGRVWEYIKNEINSAARLAWGSIASVGMSGDVPGHSG